MYYVNHEQIGERLGIIPILSEAATRLGAEWREGQPDLLHILAQERLLHLSVELVTDLGSLLIDGFLMRDASSYEDIVEIIHGEDVFAPELLEPLQRLVRLRKPLVQDYAGLERGSLHPLTVRLPDLLARFGESVQAFVAKELA
ncbi:DUF86 domain-containing protein [Paenibacillus hodogayensis]|uniref:DUF86 domain-containing protein n=1 Tax=Paenibacillus hodogayensis TaxID=279208 RepID=A0ABV5VWV8_9BACL